VALVVCQVSVVDWPLSTVSGLAVREAVGAAGGGGGGGGGGACFLWHAPRNIIAPSAMIKARSLSVACFNFSPPEYSRIAAMRGSIYESGFYARNNRNSALNTSVNSTSNSSLVLNYRRNS
jgi:hypothetical protein